MGGGRHLGQLFEGRIPAKSAQGFAGRGQITGEHGLGGQNHALAEKIGQDFAVAAFLFHLRSEKIEIVDERLTQRPVEQLGAARGAEKATKGRRKRRLLRRRGANG